MPVSLRFPSCQARPPPLLVTGGPVHRTEILSATRADTNASVLFPGGPRRDRAAPATTRRTLGSGPALPLDHSHAAARIRRAATNTCGKAFPAPHQRPAIHLVRLTPRSNAW